MKGTGIMTLNFPLSQLFRNGFVFSKSSGTFTYSLVGFVSQSSSFRKRSAAWVRSVCGHSDPSLITDYAERSQVIASARTERERWRGLNRGDEDSADWPPFIHGCQVTGWRFRFAKCASLRLSSCFVRKQPSFARPIRGAPPDLDTPMLLCRSNP